MPEVGTESSIFSHLSGFFLALMSYFKDLSGPELELLLEYADGDGNGVLDLRVKLSK